jgi:hypothetical protein
LVRTSACHADDPGSNPGDRTKQSFFQGFLGRSQDGPVIDYPALRTDFVAFLESKRFNRRYVKCMLSYLDRYVTVIRRPMDVVRVFSDLTVGQQHNLSRGLRNVFNFLEAMGFNKDYLDVLRKNVPKDEVGFDLKIPSPEHACIFWHRTYFHHLFISGPRLFSHVTR